MEVEMELKETNKQLEIDKSYLRMALIEAERSYAKRLHVGCLIVKDRRIISDGFNGTIKSFPNICEDENNVSLPWVCHAESNAISKLASSNDSCKDATIYVSHEPCINCSLLIIQSGIKRVVYNKPYRLHDGLELLKKANIEVEQIDL